MRRRWQQTDANYRGLDSLQDPDWQGPDPWEQGLGIFDSKSFRCSFSQDPYLLRPEAYL